MEKLITKTNLLGTRSAVFSADEVHRYRLQETWADGGKTMSFLMLNPSTANEFTDDPTVARCHKRALRSGFDRFEVINLFALRSTNPKALYNHPDPIGPHNNQAILDCAKNTIQSGGQLICAWGNHGEFEARAQEVLALLKAAGIPLFALKTNQNGSPAHPLYLPDYLNPVAYT
jgi:hypothetical protein